MLFEDQLPELPMDIYDGELTLGRTKYDGLIPVPLRFEGEVRLTLTMRDDGRQLLFSGAEITIETSGEFRFVETAPFDPFD